MRDPNRIPIVLAALGEVWEAHPDWRLCQLITNVVHSKLSWEVNDFFSVEDKDLLIALEEMEVGRAL